MYIVTAKASNGLTLETIEDGTKHYHILDTKYATFTSEEVTPNMEHLSDLDVITYVLVNDTPTVVDTPTKRSRRSSNNDETESNEGGI